MLREKVPYNKLNSRQRENFNFQKLSAVLADYGFTTIRLSDDWNGADLLAHHVSGRTLRIQLKSRFSIQKKYQGRGLWVAFPHKGSWFLYPHDGAVKACAKTLCRTLSWRKHSSYSTGGLSKMVESK